MTETNWSRLQCCFALSEPSLTPFPESGKEYDLLLEVAFMEGAQWAQKRTIAKLEQRLGALRQEAANGNQS